MVSTVEKQFNNWFKKMYEGRVAVESKQYREVKTAWYCSYYSALCLVEKLGSNKVITPDQAAQLILNDLKACEDWLAQDIERRTIK